MYILYIMFSYLVQTSLSAKNADWLMQEYLSFKKNLIFLYCTFVFTCRFSRFYILVPLNGLARLHILELPIINLWDIKMKI